MKLLLFAILILFPLFLSAYEQNTYQYEGTTSDGATVYFEGRMPNEHSQEAIKELQERYLRAPRDHRDQYKMELEKGFGISVTEKRSPKHPLQEQSSPSRPSQQNQTYAYSEEGTAQDGTTVRFYGRLPINQDLTEIHALQRHYLEGSGYNKKALQDAFQRFGISVEESRQQMKVSPPKHKAVPHTYYTY
ncbi:MAG: hypothetical protein S4CHLAM2_09650 [Chlamydiales bacterium]|nr:hypothetical protein [Chlamydiales bacterium]